jgi:ATP/maltotriose-dependent transcriptional regulator MalT
MIAGLPDEARAALTALPDDPAETTPHQHHQLAARGALRAVLDDLPGARADLSVLVRSSPSDVAPERLLGMGVLAEVCYRLGDWDRAVALADQALSLAEDSEQVWVQGYLHAVAGLLAGARGGQQRAADHLDAGLTLAEQLGDPATWAVCQNLAVHLAAFRAEPELVLERAQPLDALRIPPLEEPGWLGWPVQHAGALVQLGRLDDAREALDRLAELARARGSKSRLAALARVSGELATSLRDHTEARAAFEEAVALSERAESLEWAAIRSSYGRFLRRRGERRSARAQLQAAYDRFHALGATPYLQVCAEELAACGATPDAGPPTALDDLTPQEQVVVRLVAEGMSNPEIARQLVLSVKTVGYHLSNAYTKLGVHSRTQLLARVGAVVGPTV